MDEVRIHLAAAAAALEAELTKFDPLQVLQQKLSELVALLDQVSPPANPADAAPGTETPPADAPQE